MKRKLQIQNNKQHGVWEEFNEQGELKKKITFMFGMKTKTEEF